MAKPRKEQRDLAEAMRQLPGHYADRLSARTLQRIIGTAAAGQWENAVNELITALHARAEAVTAAERDDLHALLDALNMPVHVSTTWPFSANTAGTGGHLCRDSFDPAVHLRVATSGQPRR